MQTSAGAGAYYFAKREINADRQAKLEAQRRSKQNIKQMEYNEAVTGDAMASSPPLRDDTVGSPSQEANNDPAPTRHAPATEEQKIFEKSKYESSTPYRSRKGDRFS